MGTKSPPPANGDFRSGAGQAMTPGQKAYEEDCARCPQYNDGKPRKMWDRLDETEQWTWERNPTPRTFTQQEIDDDVFRDADYEDGPDPGEECGRWSNGKLTASCSKGGSEECDFECPYRGSL